MAGMTDRKLREAASPFRMNVLSKRILILTQGCPRMNDCPMVICLHRFSWWRSPSPSTWTPDQTLLDLIIQDSEFNTLKNLQKALHAAAIGKIVYCDLEPARVTDGLCNLSQ